jgi:hypothetical protein
MSSSAFEICDTDEMDNTMRASPNDEPVATFGRTPPCPVRVAAAPTTENVSLRRLQASRITGIPIMVSFDKHGLVRCGLALQSHAPSSRRTSLTRVFLRFSRMRGMAHSWNLIQIARRHKVLGEKGNGAHETLHSLLRAANSLAYAATW